MLFEILLVLSTVFLPLSLFSDLGDKSSDDGLDALPSLSLRVVLVELPFVGLTKRSKKLVLPITKRRRRNFTLRKFLT